MRRTALSPLMKRSTLVLLAGLALTACGLPPRAAAPQLYDFGPPTAVGGASAPGAPALVLRVQAGPALEGAAMLYRLAYADAHQVRAYSQSRWMAPPAELLQQRLRAGLGQHYALAPSETGGVRVLTIELEEFSQVFSAPADSHGLLRLRATLVQAAPGGERLLGQRVLQLQQPAASPDAPGGVRALAGASDAAVAELVQWLQTLR